MRAYFIPGWRNRSRPRFRRPIDYSRIGRKISKPLRFDSIDDMLAYARVHDANAILDQWRKSNAVRSGIHSQSDTSNARGSFAPSTRPASGSLNRFSATCLNCGLDIAEHATNGTCPHIDA